MRASRAREAKTTAERTRRPARVNIIAHTFMNFRDARAAEDVLENISHRSYFVSIKYVL